MQRFTFNILYCALSSKKHDQNVRAHLPVLRRSLGHFPGENIIEADVGFVLMFSRALLTFDTAQRHKFYTWDEDQTKKDYFRNWLWRLLSERSAQKLIECSRGPELRGFGESATNNILEVLQEQNNVEHYTKTYMRKYETSPKLLSCVKEAYMGLSIA